VSCLAEEIATPGPGQITIFVTLAANPALSAPHSKLLAQALSKIECMVSFDSYLNETTCHAHVILPALSLLEQPHWDVFGWPYALASGGHYSATTFEPEAGRPQDWEVMLRLAAILGGDPQADIGALDDSFFSAMCRQRGMEPAAALAACPERGPERMVELAIRSGPFGDGFGAHSGVCLRDFKQAPGGLILGQAGPQGAAALSTPSGKMELAPAYILADVARLETAMARALPELMLVSRRHLSSLNSWMHNVEILMKGKERCTLLIHPDDAQRLGIGDGDVVTVRSTAGEVSVAAEICDAVSLGIVSLPHGWGHDVQDTRMSVAKRHRGVNTNLLTPGTMDEPSSNAVLNGIPVTVRRSARPEGVPDREITEGHG
jgi:anaerobic selenocysteine-containing dehydrogenase